MTSKTSSVKINPARKMLRFTLKKQTPITLLVTAFTLVFCPGAVLREVLDRMDYVSDNLRYDLPLFFPGITAGVFIIAVALTFLLLLTNFGFLFSKRAGDMFHALPLTRNELLFTRVIAAFIGGLFTMTLAYGSLVAMSLLPMVTPLPIIHIITTYLIMVLFLAFLTAFMLMFVVTGGGAFDTILAIGAVNAALPALGAVFISFFENSAHGLDAAYDGLIYTTPFAYTVYKLACHAEGWEASNVLNIERFTIVSALLVLAFTVLMLWICSRLFRVRKSETAGEAYSFKFVPAVLSVLISVAGGYLIGLIMTSNGFESGDFWLFFLPGALLSAVAFGAISTRAFKTVKGSLIKGGIAVALTITIVLSVGFAASVAEDKVPAAEAVKSVRPFGHYSVEFTEPEDIALITQIHTTIVENNNEGYPGSTEDYQYEDVPKVLGNIEDMRLTYTLKNGREMRRNYWYSELKAKNLRKDLLALMQTDAFLADYDAAASHKINGHIRLHAAVKTETESNYVLTNKQGKELVALFKKEMLEADVSVFEEECLDLYLEGAEYRRMCVPKSFEETVAYIEALEPFESEEY